jgi:hypothetical protein
MKYAATLLLSLLFVIAGLSQSARAGTTTLTFDGLSNGTVLTNQYASEGVTISGGETLTSCPTCIFPPVSGTNVAFLSGRLDDLHV